VLQIRKSSLANTLLLRRHWPSATDDISSLTEDQLRDALQDLDTDHEMNKTLSIAACRMS
jgi:hypothetical protein